LGTRLRPLTGRLPKPLVPLFHRPLAEWALEACARAGAERFAVNTHHLPEAWGGFGDPAPGDIPVVAGGNGLPAGARMWRGGELAVFHEPVLLETGGGLKNIEGWLRGEPVLVHNGDIFSSMPLDRLVAAHQTNGLPATLALRSGGGDRRVAVDGSGTRCVDLRHALGRAAGTHVFSGIYCAEPELLDRLPAGEIVSVVDAFLELAACGRLGAVVIDDGDWLDLGDRDAYLRAHRKLALGPAVHPEAVVEPGAVVECSAVGPGAIVRSGAVVRGSVVWPGCEVLAGAVLDGCVVFSGSPVGGVHRGEDL
jgi:mannose-1-phosphate guanylyltransferase